MLYSINPDDIKSINLTPTITKTKNTRIFPSSSDIFEIHFCNPENKLSNYEVVLHFPGQKTDIVSKEIPVSTIALCIETNPSFAHRFHFNPEFRLLQKGNFILSDSVQIPENLISEMNLLFSCVEEKFRTHICDIESVKCISQKLNRISFSKIGFENYSFYYVLNALEYIETHYQEKMTIQTIADRCLLTPNYLSRLFQEITGRTVKNVIDMIRASHAREELFYSKQSIPKLAVSNGFSTGNSMRKIFQSLFQISPEECQFIDRSIRNAPLPYEISLLNLFFA